MNVPNDRAESGREAGGSVPSIPMSGAAPSASPPDDDALRPESSLRLIAVAIGWILLALGTVVAAEIVISALIDDKSVLGHDLSSIATSILFYSLLLRAALVRARIVGHGDVRAGLGDGPMSRRPVILAMVILTIAIVALVVAAYAYGYIEPPAPSSARERSAWGHLFDAFVAVLAAPPIEESWFRGWLWTGLRKRWSPLATALTTGAFFVALHLPTTFSSLAHYVVAAILLSLARHLGGSIRASIVIHAIWNLTTIVSAASFFLWG